VPVRFSVLLRITVLSVEILTVREDEVEGSETHEMATFQPYTGSVTSLTSLESTGQDVDDVARPVLSRAEGVTSILSAVESRDIYFVILTSINRMRGKQY